MDGRIFLKSLRDTSFNKIYRMILLSAWFILLDNTFKNGLWLKQWVLQDYNLGYCLISHEIPLSPQKVKGSQIYRKAKADVLYESWKSHQIHFFKYFQSCCNMLQHSEPELLNF